MTTTLHRRHLIACASAFFAAGCADIVGPPPAPKLYVLAPNMPAHLAGAPVAWGLAVQVPDSTASIATQRIAITRPPAGLDFYADAAWSDRLPLLVQHQLVEAFEASGRIAAVARDSEGARTDLILSCDLRDFEARYDQGEGAPLAVVRLGTRVLDARSRKIITTAVFTKEVRSTANSVDAAVAALTGAFAGVLAELLPWVLLQQPSR